MEAQERIASFFTEMSRRAELFLPFAIVIIVVMMVIPVPAFLVNLLVAISLTGAIITILMSMYVNEALEFSVFPTVILVSTIYRLALNITTTRAILLHAHESAEPAGAIITTFGNFVTGGSYIVGIIIFAIIVIVNYTVITHGAQRIGEVAARFTLDAMPGKQMSIDADLNNGLINDEQARQRRRKIEREADYFGAMDGASRFVQRDAIAGIIITLINIGGGFILGAVVYDMPITEALQRYTMLTIGDGLAAALPTLLMSTATGIMVTNAASDANLSSDMVGQVFAQPKALATAAIVLGLFTVFSTFAVFTGSFSLGLFVSLLAMTLLTGGLAFALNRSAFSFAPAAATAGRGAGAPPAGAGRPAPGGAAPSRQGESAPPPDTAPALTTQEAVTALLHVDTMELEIGYGLIPLVDPEQKGDLLDRVTMIRRQTALEMGIVVPPIRIRDNIQLKPNEYCIKIRGTDVARGTLMVDYFLAMNPGHVTQDVEGIDTTEPAFGLPAKWIRENRKEQAEMLGYTVVDPASVVATHLTEVIKNHAYELLGRQEVQSLVDVVKEKHSVVVEELIPGKMTLGELQKVLQNLLRERVSIRNMVTILEVLADYSPMTKDVNVLTEYTRAGLARQICKQHQMPDGSLPVITLDPQLEEAIVNSVQQTEGATYPVLPPDMVQRLNQNLTQAIEKAVSLNYQPIIMCSPRVRMYVRRLVERMFPSLVVLSHSEVTADIRVKSVGQVTV